MPLFTEKQARAAVNILTRNAHHTVERGLVQLQFKKPGEPKNKAISTRKSAYAGELGSDNGEIEVAMHSTAAKRCVELLNMLARIWQVNIGN